MKKNVPLKKSRETIPNTGKHKVLKEKTRIGGLSASWKANRYLHLFFFLFAFLLYGNTIFNHYAVDDTNVTNNEQVKQGFKALPEIFKSRCITEQGNIGSTSSDYRPVVKATFAVEYALWGQKTGRSHALNILIYWLISILVFSVLRRILINYNILFPFLITLMFMAHPVHTEVVASLKNRDELLAFLCGIGSLRLVLAYIDSRKLLYLFLAFVVFVTGYLSKSSILPFILLLPLVLYYFTEVSGKATIALFVLMLAAVIVSQYGPKLYLANTLRTNLIIENPLYGVKDIWLRLGTGLVSLLFYIRILLYPHPLLYYYGFNMFPVVSLANLTAIFSLLVHGGLLFIAIRQMGKRTIISFAIFWYLIAIAMYSNALFPVAGIVGERFVFAASLGFSIMLIYGIFRLFKTDPKNLTIEMDTRLKILTLIMLILVPYSILTVTRNRDWRNLFDLYRADIKHLDNSAKANIDYAGFLMNSVYQDENFLRNGTVNQFKYEIIKDHFRKALNLYPDNYKTTNDLGTVYLFIGKQYDSAVYYLQKAIAMDSTLQPAWVNLGMAYRELKQYDKAIGCYKHILRINPNQIKAVFALANVYNDMGDFDRAVKMNEDMAKKYPHLEMPYVNIGNYYMLRKDTLAAVSNWEKAVAIRPSFELCVQLNSLYLIKRDKQKADYYYDLGIELSKQSQ